MPNHHAQPEQEKKDSPLRTGTQFRVPANSTQKLHITFMMLSIVGIFLG